MMLSCQQQPHYNPKSFPQALSESIREGFFYVNSVVFVLINLVMHNDQPTHRITCFSFIVLHLMCQ